MVSVVCTDQYGYGIRIRRPRARSATWQLDLNGLFDTIDSTIEGISTGRTCRIREAYFSQIEKPLKNNNSITVPPRRSCRDHYLAGHVENGVYPIKVY